MIKLVVDSACDISKEYAQANNIDVLPLHVKIGDTDYLDGVTISGHEFFEKLIECDDLPKTAQIAPGDFMDTFEKYKDDDVICITLSKKLSGTYQSAVLATEEYPNVHVIDSENVTVGETLLIKLAVRLINEGKNVAEVVDILEKEKYNIRLVALLDTLEYLKKGGRISAATAFIGGILNIKPVVEVIDGEVKLIGKARGSKMGNNKLREKIDEYGGIDFNKPYGLAYSGLSDELLQKYIKDSSDVYPEGTVFDQTLIGPTIGTHVGPGAIACAFFKK